MVSLSTSGYILLNDVDHAKRGLVCDNNVALRCSNVGVGTPREPDWRRLGRARAPLDTLSFVVTLFLLNAAMLSCNKSVVKTALNYACIRHQWRIIIKHQGHIFPCCHSTAHTYALLNTSRLPTYFFLQK